jgi:hypothetical protein
MATPKQVIGALIKARVVRDEVARQVRPLGDVWFANDADALIERAAAEEASIVVVELRDVSGESVLPIIGALAARAPRTQVIIFDDVVGRPAAEVLLAILLAHPGTDYVVRRFEPLGSAVRRRLAVRDVPETVTALLLPQIEPVTLPPLRPFMTLAMLKGPLGRSAERIARWSGVTLRTIERRLERAGWGPPHVVVQSVRALDVVMLMAEHRWSARRVMRVRGYAHESAISRLVHSYAGVGPGTVRESGGVPVALKNVIEKITHRRPRETGTR